MGKHVNLFLPKKKLFVRLIPGHIANDVTEGDAQTEDGRPGAMF
jgi:hypothetical protein